MAVLPPPWDLFMATVEGRESTASCVLVDRLPVLSFVPIPPGAPPNPQMLADFLRSGHPIPDIILAWMADMLDPPATSDRRLVVQKRRGRPVRPIDAHWPAVAFFEDLVDTMNRQEALYQTCQAYGIETATLEAAINQHDEAVTEAERVMWKETPEN